MSKDKQEGEEFSIPDNFIEKLYEFSGGVDKYKGIILATCTEKGTPMIYSRYESGIVELGLKQAMSEFVNRESGEV